MKEIKKYTDIIRFGKREVKDIFNEKSFINVTEKIDGANAQFTYDDGNIACFSRNTVVNEENTLRGFYGWVKECINPKDLVLYYRYIGEWSCKHKIRYKKEFTNKFFLFDIWDDINECYLPSWIVRSEARRLGLMTPDVFYYGPYVSEEHLRSFVGKSRLTEVENDGEGIVIKDYEYKNYENKQKFIKIVRDDFSEVKNTSDKVQQNEALSKILNVLTDARIEKVILKAFDEKHLNEENLNMKNMGKTVSILTPLVLDDMIKEELDLLHGISESDIKRAVNKKVPKVFIKMLDNGEFDE